MLSSRIILLGKASGLELLDIGIGIESNLRVCIFTDEYNYMTLGLQAEASMSSERSSMIYLLADYWPLQKKALETAGIYHERKTCLSWYSSASPVWTYAKLIIDFLFFYYYEK